MTNDYQGVAFAQDSETRGLKLIVYTEDAVVIHPFAYGDPAALWCLFGLRFKVWFRETD